MEKMSFLEFRNEFAGDFSVPLNEVAILAPIVCSFKPEYFEVCSQFLLYGQEKELIFGDYSTTIIKQTI